MENVKYVDQYVKFNKHNRKVLLRFVQREGEDEPRGIEPWGIMYLNYIYNWKKKLFKEWISDGGVDGGLGEYLQSLNETANEREKFIIASMAEADGTDEDLRARDPEKWTGLMNNYKSCALEMISSDLIYN